MIKIGLGVFELQGSKNWGLPLTWLVALTTVQHYRADCDVPGNMLAYDIALLAASWHAMQSLLSLLEKLSIMLDLTSSM